MTNGAQSPQPSPRRSLPGSRAARSGSAYEFEEPQQPGPAPPASCCKSLMSAAIALSLGPEVGEKGKVVVAARPLVALAAVITAIAGVLYAVVAFQDIADTELTTFDVGPRDPSRSCVGVPGSGIGAQEKVFGCWAVQSLTMDNAFNESWLTGGVMGDVVSNEPPAVSHVNGVERPEGSPRYVWQRLQAGGSLTLDGASTVPPGFGFVLATTVNAAFVSSSDTEFGDLPDTEVMQELVGDWHGTDYDIPLATEQNLELRPTLARRFGGSPSMEFFLCDGAPRSAVEDSAEKCDPSAAGVEFLDSVGGFNLTYDNGVTVRSADLVCLAATLEARELAFGRADFLCFTTEQKSTLLAVFEAATASLGLLGVASIVINSIMCRKAF